MNKIIIALACDDAYARAVALSVHSIRSNSGAEIEFVVLNNGLTDENRARIERTAGGASEVRFVTVDERPFSQFRRLRDSTATYMRLVLPELVAEDWVLYSDADTLWRGDVAELWRERDERYAAVAALDCEASVRADGGVVGEYFCAGIMLVNLRMWREEGLAAKCAAWLNDHPEAVFYDQSAINRVLRGRVKMVDKKWNRYVGEEGEAKVMHYAGHLPWALGLRMGWLNEDKLGWFRVLAKFEGVSVWRALRFYNPAWRIVVSWLMGKVRGQVEGGRLKVEG